MKSGVADGWVSHDSAFVTRNDTTTAMLDASARLRVVRNVHVGYQVDHETGELVLETEAVDGLPCGPSAGFGSDQFTRRLVARSGV